MISVLHKGQAFRNSYSAKKKSQVHTVCLGSDHTAGVPVSFSGSVSPWLCSGINEVTLVTERCN